MKVTQAFTFEAAHFLPGVPDGHRCKRMHGHSYRVELTFAGEIDPQSGFVVDFFEIERCVGPIVAELDHCTLNEIAGLQNPTVEIIADWFAARTRKLMPNLVSVRVYETPFCWAETP